MLAAKGRSTNLLYVFSRKSLQFSEIVKDREKISGGVIFKTIVTTSYSHQVREIETSCDLQLFRILSNWISSTKTFGVELSVLVKRPSSVRGIPAVVLHTTQWIREYGIVEGIFRKSGSTKDIEQFKTNYDEGLIESLLNIEPKTDPNVVAGGLKMFFRLLPTPIIIPSLYVNFLDLNTDDPDCIYHIKSLLKTLPRNNYTLLHYLCRFLYELSKKSLITLMDITNLSIVFASNIIRPSLDTPEDTLRFNKVTVVMAKFIEYESILFESEKEEPDWFKNILQYSKQNLQIRSDYVPETTKSILGITKKESIIYHLNMIKDQKKYRGELKRNYYFKRTSDEIRDFL